MKNSLLFLLLFFTMKLFGQHRYDVVIHEIMADPSPTVGLPAIEWIELKNRSNLPMQLQGWRICDANNESGTFPAFILQPDSVVIIASVAAASGMSPFGAVIGVSAFPSLDNTGEIVFIRAADGRIIHGIKYHTDWYRNELKKEGGWSLEMIDAQYPCVGAANWKASVNNAGGTPGQRNSIESVLQSQEPDPTLNGFVSGNNQIHLVFEDAIDSSSAFNLSAYSSNPPMSWTGVELLPPLFNEVKLTTNTSLLEKQLYTLRIDGVRDCNGISLPRVEIKTGTPSPAMKDDIVVNEIMFNPHTTGEDYVELFNRSDKIIDIAQLSICNRNNAGALNSITPISIIPRYLLPGQYVLLTHDAVNLALHYLVKDEKQVLPMSALPSLPDDEGEVILLNKQGEIIDEVNYSEDWHFKLIQNAEGISLERIDANRPSGDPGNWHSASSTAGYGTPGYKNSQAGGTQLIDHFINIPTSIFSPDNDGLDDFLQVQYQLETPGYVANITVFDVAGRPVRNLVRNQLLGTSGSWTWDGLNEKGLKLPIGPYIIFAEVFNLEGKKKQWKQSVILARRLNG